MPTRPPEPPATSAGLALEAERLRRIRTICMGWPEVEETTLQDRPLFRVRKRRFAIVNGSWCATRPRWANAGPSLHVLTDSVEAGALRADPRFQPSPHHGEQGWVALRLDAADIAWDEISELLETAYRTAAPRALVATLDKPLKSRRPVQP